MTRLKRLRGRLVASRERNVKVCQIMEKRRRDWDEERKKDDCRGAFITGLPVRPVIKWAFGPAVSKSGLPGEGRHQGLVPRNDVLTNGFI